MRRQIHRSSYMRPRLVMRPRIQNKLRRNLVLTGSAILVNAALVFSYFYFGKTESTHASQLRNGGNGNWNSPSTWTSGRVPASNDTVTIMAGNTVVITNSTQVYDNMKIIIKGTLRLNGGRKLSMCNGAIDVEPGGSILGDNAGSMIDMCALSVWNGSMPGTGPIQLPPSVLPVELAYFKAESSDNRTVNILWETASEVNCDYFAIERSADGSNFESLSKIHGAGNSSTSRQYSFVDDSPHTPVSYYRLKQVDFDGKFEMFKVISVNMNLQHEMVIYPNPATHGEAVTVQVPAGSEKSIQVLVTDMQGKQIFMQSLEKEHESDNAIRFVTEKFPAAGTYFITASGATNKYLKKIVVL